MLDRKYFPASESGKAVSVAVFSSSNHGSVTQSSVVCALIHTTASNHDRTSGVCTFLELVVDGALAPNVSSFIVELVWRVFRPINWTRDCILQEIVEELD